MNEDEKVKIYNKVFEAVQKHTQPSPETKNFMQKVDETFKEIKTKIDNLPTKESMLLANAELLKSMMEEVKKDFVSKEEFKPIKAWIYGMIGLVGTYVIGSLLNLL